MAAPIIEHLTVVLGYTQLALRVLAPDAPARPYLQHVEAATHRAIHDIRMRLATDCTFACRITSPTPSPPPDAPPLMP
jgi:hypothetical protein